MNNPIIDEVRRIRDEHARRFNYDLAAICADLRRHQKACGHTVVSGRVPLAVQGETHAGLSRVAENPAGYEKGKDL